MEADGDQATKFSTEMFFREFLGEQDSFQLRLLGSAGLVACSCCWARRVHRLFWFIFVLRIAGIGFLALGNLHRGVLDRACRQPPVEILPIAQ